MKNLPMQSQGIRITTNLTFQSLGSQLQIEDSPSDLVENWACIQDSS